MIVEAIVGGIEALEWLPEAAPIKAQLETLKSLAQCAIESVEGFAQRLIEKLKWRI